MNKTILIHFGEPKCASSSVQLALSMKPSIKGLFEGSEVDINYYIYDGINFIQGADFISVNQEFMLGNGLGYYNSTYFSVARFAGKCIHKMLVKLSDQMRDNEVAILSFEKWGENFIELSSLLEEKSGGGGVNAPMK